MLLSLAVAGLMATVTTACSGGSNDGHDDGHPHTISRRSACVPTEFDVSVNLCCSGNETPCGTQEQFESALAMANEKFGPAKVKFTLKKFNIFQNNTCTEADVTQDSAAEIKKTVCEHGSGIIDILYLPTNLGHGISKGFSNIPNITNGWPISAILHGIDGPRMAMDTLTGVTDQYGTVTNDLLLTHELGHAFGLYHDDGHEDSLMYPSVGPLTGHRKSFKYAFNETEKDIICSVANKRKAEGGEILGDKLKSTGPADSAEPGSAPTRQPVGPKNGTYDSEPLYPNPHDAHNANKTRPSCGRHRKGAHKGSHKGSDKGSVPGPATPAGQRTPNAPPADGSMPIVNPSGGNNGQISNGGNGQHPHPSSPQANQCLCTCPGLQQPLAAAVLPTRPDLLYIPKQPGYSPTGSNRDQGTKNLNGGSDQTPSSESNGNNKPQESQEKQPSGADNAEQPSGANNAEQPSGANNAEQPSSADNANPQAQKDQQRFFKAGGPKKQGNAAPWSIVNKNSTIPASNSTVPTSNSTVPTFNATVPTFNSTVSAPDSTVRIPDSTVRIPDSTVHIPDSTVRIPDSTVSTPDSTVSTPDSTVSTPDSTVSTPDSTVSTPDSTVSTPDSTESTPDSTESTPDSTESTPDSTLYKPDSTESNPDSNVRTFKSTKATSPDY
ncbi:hypothetical protein DCS_04356 [Drechmeria coniospora]|uniref:Peptidase M10 metallopeptidase domain-containing protein n=1 Tax=Drechmeria coniospora TaxID=98403 RepID=A0A151GJS0_DRECN|nr:hypothetical protein DCS_04356 [Drechmeria coniospora]KYK57347.1 hypothetical protein DCS_04356 [Drechmeria coniospora]